MGNITSAVRAALRVLLMGCACTGVDAATLERLCEAGVRVDDATDDNRVNVRKILAAHGRFAYVNDLTLRYVIRKESLEDRVRVLPVVLGDEPMYFRVGRNAAPALAPLLGAALDRLKASGKLDRINARWADLAP